LVVNFVGELDIVPGAVPTEELELEPPVGNGAIGAVPEEEPE